MTILFTNQKMNAKSSTEEYLIGVYDDISRILWLKYLIESQEYTFEHNKFFNITRTPSSYKKW